MFEINIQFYRGLGSYLHSFLKKEKKKMEIIEKHLVLTEANSSRDEIV